MSLARSIASLLSGGGGVVLQDTATGAAKIPTGTTAQRPASPTNGYTRHNTTIGSLEFWDAGAGAWIATNLIPVVNSVTGSIYAGAASTLSLSLSNATDKIDVVFSKAGTVLATVTNVTVAAGVASGVSVPSGVYNAVAGGDVVAISIKNQDGTPSSNNQSKTVVGLPTGGTITSAGGYRYHTFGSSGSLSIPAGFSVTADYLVVAGGGGGGCIYGDNTRGGGGGAGGYLSGSISLASSVSHSIVVGGGGSGSAPSNGSASSISGTGVSVNAVGGGYGGNRPSSGYIAPSSGGSGGGGVYSQNAGGSGTSGQGNRGGAGSNSTTYYCGGGGGGAGAVGGDATGSVSGLGGNGLSWINGSTYAGGGSGGGAPALTNPAGGTGGGGSGTTGTGGNGSVNTGGGGAGAGWPDNSATNTNGGSGGSGIVIIRYAL